VKSIRIESLGQLVDKATPNKPDRASGRYRKSVVYRGVSDPKAPLLTGLDRLGGAGSPHSKKHLEGHLLRNFIRYARPFLPHPEGDVWHIMVAAEHHGLPTRLLDWTHSPLIAAHFATLDMTAHTDRAIWRLDWKKVHRGFGFKEVTFLLEDLAGMLRERGFDDSWGFLNQVPPEGRDFVCLFEPPATTARLEAQSGAFTLASSKDESLEQILGRAGLADALERFVIPSSKVGLVRDQLDICAVDERHLFPGLDGIAAELRRYYSGQTSLEQAVTEIENQE